MQGRTKIRITFWSLCLLLNLGGLFFFEITLRILAPPYRVPDRAGKVYNFTDSSAHTFGYGLFDPNLGMRLKPNSERTGPYGEKITIDNSGLRSNDNDFKPPNDAHILALGDSNTFGFEVDNKNTWPSKLESILQFRIKNAGVMGYGIDQMYTMLKYQIEISIPELILFAFIEDDIRRVMARVRHGQPKPFYTLDNGKLNFHPLEVNQVKDKIDLFKKIFGYSYFIHVIMTNFSPDYWQRGSLFEFQFAPGDANVLACELIRSASAYAIEKGVNKIVFIELPSGVGDIKLIDHPVTQCIHRLQNPKVLNLNISQSMQDAQPRLILKNLFKPSFGRYGGHYSEEGTAFVATTISNFLRSNHRDLSYSQAHF